MNIENLNQKIEEGIKKLVKERAKSKSQRKLFALAKSVKSGETLRSEVSKDVLDIADKVSGKEIDKFATTKEKGLPEKVKKDKVEETSNDNLAQAYGGDSNSWPSGTGEWNNLEEESEIPTLNLDDVDLTEDDK